MSSSKAVTRKVYRCPECYARVVGEPDDDKKTTLWLHEKPRRKERLEAMLGEEWG
jgi:hypothetical protein